MITDPSMRPTWRDRILMISTVAVVLAEIAVCLVPIWV
jgi:hypothetical protein